MTIDYIKQALGNRLKALIAARDSAFQVGDLEVINKLDIEINETQQSIDQLNNII